MLEKNMFFNTVFSRFFVVLTSENDSKIDVFSLLFRKRQFCQNHCFSKGKLLFFRFWDSQKPSKIDAETHSKKTSKKNFQKSILASVWASQNLPKSTQHRQKSEKKAFEKKLEKKKPRESPTRAATQRKASLLGPRGTIQLPFQWLVLLYLSIYLLICPSSP